MTLCRKWLCALCRKWLCDTVGSDCVTLYRKWLCDTQTVQPAISHHTSLCLEEVCDVVCSARTACLMQCPCSKFYTVSAASSRGASLAPRANPMMFFIWSSASLTVMVGKVSGSLSPLSSTCHPTPLVLG